MQRNWIAAAKVPWSISNSITRRITAVSALLARPSVSSPLASIHLRRHHRCNSRPNIPSSPISQRPIPICAPRSINSSRAAQSQRGRRHRRNRKARRPHRPLCHQSLQRRKVPVWVANYILMDYGTGAIMSVPRTTNATTSSPGIQSRDPPRDSSDHERPGRTMTEPALPFVAHDGMLINSGSYSGLECAEAIAKCPPSPEKTASASHRHLSLKRLGISRQRYGARPSHALLRKRWHRSPCRKKDLPVILPENVNIALALGSR